MLVPVLSAIDQVGVAQHREVAGHGRPGKLELGRQLPGGHVPLPEQREHAPPRRIGEGLVDTVDLDDSFGGCLIRRTPKYASLPAVVNIAAQKPAARLGGDAEAIPTPVQMLEAPHDDRRPRALGADPRRRRPAWARRPRIALAKAGYNICGIHLDFRAALAHVEEVKAAIAGDRLRGAVHQHERRRRREARGRARGAARAVRPIDRRRAATPTSGSSCTRSRSARWCRSSPRTRRPASTARRWR